jgi:hypothetical protein
MFEALSIARMDIEPTNSILFRASRFFRDRHAYRSEPSYLTEFVAFGIVVFIAVWPLILLANVMASVR